MSMEQPRRSVETPFRTKPDEDPHEVVEEAETVPGKHPDPERRYPGQTEYLEQYLRCRKCGVTVLRTEDLPSNCGAEADSA